MASVPSDASSSSTQSTVQESKSEPVAEEKSTLAQVQNNNLPPPSSCESFSSPDIKKDDPIPEPDPKPPISTPLSIDSKIFKLQNRIKHLEFAIDRNRANGQQLSQECFTLLRCTELLAFNFLFSEYLLGKSTSDDVYRFLDHCINPDFDLSTGNIEDFNKATQYVKNLQEQISNSASNLLTNDLRRPEIPRRTSEFITYLTEQKKNIENRATLRNQAQNLSEAQILTETKVEDLPSAFAKWLCTELRIDMEPDEESIELRSLIGCVARRLTSVSNLHRSITELKKKTLDPSQLEYTDCDPEALLQSPYLVGLQNSCQFLMSLHVTLQTQSQIIPALQMVLERCRQELEHLKASSDFAIEQMKTHIEEVRRSVDEIIAEKDKLPPIFQTINLIFTRMKLNTADTHKFYNQLIEQDLGLPDDQKEAELKALTELRDQREQIDGLISELTILAESIQQKNRELFRLIHENCKAEFEQKLQELEEKHLKEYEAGLKQVVESAGQKQLQAWTTEIRRILDSLKEAKEQQDSLLEQQFKMAQSDHATEEEAEKLTKEITELSMENYRMCQLVGKSKLEMDAAIEDLFRAQQEMELYKDWLPDFIDRDDDRQARQYRDMVICPICRMNRRDCILATCGHPMCRSCIENEKNHKCPFPKCQTPFTDADVKPFFLQ